MRLCSPRSVIIRCFIKFLFLNDVLCEFKGPCDTNKLCLCSELRYSCYMVPLMSMPLWGEWALEGKHLDLTEAPFQLLTDSALDGLQLWTLTIARTNLHTIELGAFTSVGKSIYSLDFRKNYIQHFPFRQLGTLKKLGALYMDDNYLTSFSDEDDREGDFGNLKATLTCLSLSGNSFTHIKEHSLSKLSNLRELNLARNRIQSIDTKSLPSSLIYLQLDDNLLRALSCDVFKDITALKILHVAKNMLQNFTCTNNTMVHLIDISGNTYEIKEPTYKKLPYCARNIKMDSNRLLVLPNLRSDCQVEKLSLRYNHIQSIEGKFNKTFLTLKGFILDHNNLFELPKAIVKLTNLKLLYLAYNNFTEAPMLPKTLRYLSLAGNYLTSIPDQRLRETYSLISIDLSYNRIDRIEREDFSGWSKYLKEINLAGNQLTHIEENTFQYVNNLYKLNLNFNDLNFIHKNALSNRSEFVYEMELSFNLLGTESKFQEQSFWNLVTLSVDNNIFNEIRLENVQRKPKLKNLNMIFNRIKKYDTSAILNEFDLPTETLAMSYNYIEEINETSFKLFPKLRFCDLSHNLLTHIQTKTFNDLYELDFISLESNLLKSINETSFNNLLKLRSILLNRNKLEILSFDWFHNVSTVLEETLTINATHNAIKNVTGMTNSHIGTIDVSFNSIQHIPNNVFSSIGDYLHELYLAFNNIQDLEPTMFTGLIVLQKLDLSGNFIKNIKSKTFQEMENLQILILKNNLLNFLGTEVFWNQKKLRFLDLENNSLTYIPNDLFKNTMIEILNLGRNSLLVYPAKSLLHIGFTLKHIDLSFNKIDSIDPSMFFNTPFLENLILRRTNLSRFSHNDFDYLPNLALLDLSSNFQNTNIEQLLRTNFQIIYLFMDQMGIENVPNLTLKNLTVLSLNHNKITVLESNNFIQLLNLKKLCLNNNKITYINNRVWFNLKKLLYLDLSNNHLLSLKLDSFQNLHQLTSLNVKSTDNMTVIHEHIFSPLRSIKYLYLDCCSNINGSKLNVLSGLEPLNELNVHLTDEILKDQLKGLRIFKMMALTISGRQVTDVSNEAFEGINVEQLHLSLTHTSVKELPKNLFKDLGRIPFLSLELSRNKLKSIDPATFYQNESTWQRYGTKLLMNGISAKNNPLKCDCNSWWIAAWLRRWLRESDDGRSVDKIYEVSCLDENNIEMPLVKAAHLSQSTECEMVALQNHSPYTLKRNSFHHLSLCEAVITIILYYFYVMF